MHNRKLSAIFHRDSPFIEEQPIVEPYIAIERKEKINIKSLPSAMGDLLFSRVNGRVDFLLKELVVTGILLLHEKLKKNEIEACKRLTPVLIEDSTWPKDAGIFDRVLSKMFGNLGVESGYWEQVIRYNSEITKRGVGRHLALTHSIIWPKSHSTALMVYGQHTDIILSDDPRLENRAFVVPVVQYSNLLQEAPDFTFFSNEVNPLSFGRYSQGPLLEEKPESRDVRSFRCDQKVSIHAPVLGVITLED